MVQCAYISLQVSIAKLRHTQIRPVQSSPVRYHQVQPHSNRPVQPSSPISGVIFVLICSHVNSTLQLQVQLVSSWPPYSQSASPGRLGRLGRLAFCNQPALSRLSRLGRLEFSRFSRLGRLSFSSYVIWPAGRSDFCAWCLKPAEWFV